MPFTYPQKIKFKHCDPAGIVFYPRYFEMINDTVEAFFEEVLSFPFAQMQPANGIPTAEINARFTAPSRLGDSMEINLHITRVGRSSLDLAYRAVCGTEQRFAASSTLVFVNGEGKPTPWPEPVRIILQTQTEGEDDAT